MGKLLYGVLPKLSKNYILSQITQEEIFEYYFGVKIQIDALLCSPIRKDKTPSFGFKYNNKGKLRGRDFGGYFWGDCFDAVAYILNVNANSKQGFGIILDRIARDFRVHKYGSAEYREKIKLPKQRELKSSIKKKVVIQVKTRGWNRLDAEYWTQFGITREILKHFDIFPAKHVWINKQLVYNYNPEDPAYAYNFGGFDDSKLGNQIKVYFPNRIKGRFIGNTSIIQGIDKLTRKSNILFITKSYKDVACLYSLGYDSIAPQSESTFITEEELNILLDQYEDVIIFYDNDITGIERAKYFSDLYELSYTHIPKVHDEKDITDYCAAYGISRANELIDELIQKIKNQ